MKNLDERTKKMLFLAGGITALLIVIIIVALVVGKIKNSSLTYDQIEDKMTEAAKSYYASRNDQLPINETEEIEVNASLLASSGYMKELSKIQKDKSVACEGKVVVTKSGEYYNYSPYLNCGDKFTTTYLYEKVMSGVVSKDDGLYKTEQYSKKGKQTIYVYRGDFVNNFVSIDDVLWRIVKVNPDFSLMLIQEYVDKDNGYRDSWDNRYNAEKGYNDGINDYYKSIIRNAIKNYYLSDRLSNSFKSKLVATPICVGLRKDNDTSKDGKIECSTTIEGDYLSLLTAYDFMNASLSSTCKTIVENNCNNYNYLSTYPKTFWLLTASSDTTFQGYRYSSGISKTRLSSTASARLVANITKNSVYVKGSGTETDPYIIK